MSRSSRVFTGTVATAAEAFGMRLRAARESLGLSQRAFAQLLRVGSSHISRIEKGLAPPSHHFLLAVEYVHGIKRTWLLTGEAPIWRGTIPAAGPAR